MVRKLFLLISSGLICTCGFLSGCSKKDAPEKPHQEAATAKGAHEAVVRKQTEVAVPASVKGKWKSVKISIMDKEKKKEEFVDIEIGKTVKVNGTDLVIEIETFLPHFIMDGTTLTSSSNSPKNPAAQIHVTENGRDVFNGWLFTLYPNTHASKHVRYGFGLVDFTPVQ